MTLRTAASLVVVALFTTAPAVAAQRAPDIETLEGRLAEAHDGFDRQASSLDRRTRADLQTELVTLDDDIAYLRVKTRRKEAVPERERRDVADRLDSLIRKLDQGRRETTAGNDEIPLGTELDVRLESRLSSGRRGRGRQGEHVDPGELLPRRRAARAGRVDPRRHGHRRREGLTRGPQGQRQRALRPARRRHRSYP